jgi:hypothetical protein
VDDWLLVKQNDLVFLQHPTSNLQFLTSNLNMQPDPEILKSLVLTKMPFGKYAGRLLANLPVSYLEWFSRKGFPQGKLGMQLQTLYEIKINGLDEILMKLKSLHLKG